MKETGAPNIEQLAELRKENVAGTLPTGEDSSPILSTPLSGDDSPAASQAAAMPLVDLETLLSAGRYEEALAQAKSYKYSLCRFPEKEILIKELGRIPPFSGMAIDLNTDFTALIECQKDDLALLPGLLNAERSERVSETDLPQLKEICDLIVEYESQQRLIGGGSQSKDNQKVLVRLLERSTLHPNFKDNKGTPILCLLAQFDYAVADTLIQSLLAHPTADVNAEDAAGRTALFYAEDEAVLSLLIEHGAKVTHRDKSGNTPLEWAVKKSNCEKAEYLVEQLDQIFAYKEMVNLMNKWKQKHHLNPTSSEEDSLRYLRCLQNKTRNQIAQSMRAEFTTENSQFLMVKRFLNEVGEPGLVLSKKGSDKKTLMQLMHEKYINAQGEPSVHLMECINILEAKGVDITEFVIPAVETEPLAADPTASASSLAQEVSSGEDIVRANKPSVTSSHESAREHVTEPVEHIRHSPVLNNLPAAVPGRHVERLVQSRQSSARATDTEVRDSSVRSSEEATVHTAAPSWATKCSRFFICTGKAIP